MFLYIIEVLSNKLVCHAQIWKFFIRVRIFKEMDQNSAWLMCLLYRHEYDYKDNGTDMVFYAAGIAWLRWWYNLRKSKISVQYVFHEPKESSNWYKCL